VRAAQDVDVLIDDEPVSTVGGRNNGLPLALLAMAVVVVADRLTKIWAESRLIAGPCRAGGDECIDLLLGLRLHLVYNRGAAFSTGPRLGPLFGVVALVMALVLLNIARSRRDRLGPLLLGVVAGGAIGNLIDRVIGAEEGFLTGAVVDFVDLQWWPVFNVADSAVVVGVIVIIVRSMFDPAHSGDDEAVDVRIDLAHSSGDETVDDRTDLARRDDEAVDDRTDLARRGDDGDPEALA
jgi:signal peptidase II